MTNTSFTCEQSFCEYQRRLVSVVWKQHPVWCVISKVGKRHFRRLFAYLLSNIKFVLISHHTPLSHSLIIISLSSPPCDLPPSKSPVCVIYITPWIMDKLSVAYLYSIFYKHICFPLKLLTWIMYDAHHKGRCCASFRLWIWVLV